MKKAENKVSPTSVVLLAFAAFLLFGVISGLRLCSVVSGSMEPNIPTWSLCVINTRASYESIEVGDVVVYSRSNGKRIIHRVIEITPEGLITKGDANFSDDGVSVTSENLVGKTLFHIPYLGYCGKIMQYPFARIVAAAYVILVAFWDRIGGKLTKKDKNDESHDGSNDGKQDENMGEKAAETPSEIGENADTK